MNLESGGLGYERSAFEKKYLESLQAEPNKKKQLSGIRRQINIINELDFSQPDSIKTKKAIKVLHEDFGMYDLSAKLQQRISPGEKRSLENEVKQTLDFLQSLHDKLKPKSSEEDSVSLKRKRDELEVSEPHTKRQRVDTGPDYEQFLYLFSPHDQDEELSTLINKQLLFLDFGDKMILKELISTIPQDDRKQIFISLCSLLKDNMSVEERQAFFNGIMAVPGENRPSTIEILRLRAPFGTSFEIVSPHAVSCAQKLLSSEMRPDEKEQMYRLIQAIPVEDREDYTQMIKLVHIDAPSARGEWESSDWIAEIEDQSSETKTNFLDAFRQVNQFFSNKSVSDKSKLLDLIVNKPQQEREEIMQYLTSLSLPRQKDPVSSIAQLIIRIPRKERAEIVQYATSLFSPEMDARDKNHVLRLISSMPLEGRADFVKAFLMVPDFTDWIKASLETGEDTCNVLFKAAIRTGDLEIVKQFLVTGIDVNFQDGNGETVLMEAVVSGHLEITKLLLDAGADVNIQNKKEETALLMLKTERPPHHKLARALIKTRCLPEVCNYSKFYMQTKSLAHTFQLKGTSITQGKEVSWESWSHPIAAKTISDSISAFAKRSPLFLEETTANRLAQSMQLAADQNEYTSRDILDRIHKGEPTFINTGYLGHAVAVLIWKDPNNDENSLYLSCDRARLVDSAGVAKPKKMLEIYRFDLKRLDEKSIQLILDASGNPAKEYVEVMKKTIPEKLQFYQTENEYALERAVSLPEQIVGNCAFASKEGALKGAFLLEKLENNSFMLPSEKFEEFKRSVDITHTGLVHFQQARLLEKYLENEQHDPLLAEKCFESLWNFKETNPLAFDDRLCQQLEAMEAKELASRAPSDALDFRMQKTWTVNQRSPQISAALDSTILELLVQEQRP